MSRIPRPSRPQRRLKLRTLAEAQAYHDGLTTRQPETGQSPTWPSLGEGLGPSGEQSENPLFNRLPQDSPDQEASPRNSVGEGKYLVEILKGDEVVRSVRTPNRQAAQQLAYDTMQFAATTYNAILDHQGDDFLVVERSQYSNSLDDWEGLILVEWAVFPDRGDVWAARVTVSEEAFDTDTRDDDEDEDTIIVLLF
jgi:hypothetical protein